MILLHIVTLALFLCIAVMLGCLLAVIALAALGDDTDDTHKPDDCPPVLPPHASLPVIHHIDIYA